MQARISFYAIAAALGWSVAPAFAQHAVSLAANTPSVSIAPRNEARSLRLPPLDYEFALTPTCATPLAPQSVTVTIADTKTTLGGGELAENADLRLALTVPAEQIAPVTVAGFCMLAEDSDGEDPRAEPATTGPVTIPGTLSASASLRCGDGQDESIVYATELLDVTLICAAESPATGTTVSPQSANQE